MGFIAGLVLTGVAMKVARVLILFLMFLPQAMQAQEIEISKPPFIEAAVFFLSGREAGQEKPWLKAVPLSASAMLLPGVRIEQDKEHPCVVYAEQTGPSYGVERFDFALFPGPLAAKISRDGFAVFALSGEAHCAAVRTKDGQFEADPSHCEATMIVGGPDTHRRLSALQYIRDNFCVGIPEPKLTVKPY
jgi:hypothetical protein